MKEKTRWSEKDSLCSFAIFCSVRNLFRLVDDILSISSLTICIPLSSVFRNPKSNKYYFYYITNLYLTQCKKPVRLIIQPVLPEKSFFIPSPTNSFSNAIWHYTYYSLRNSKKYCVYKFSHNFKTSVCEKSFNFSINKSTI